MWISIKNTVFKKRFIPRFIHIWCQCISYFFRRFLKVQKIQESDSGIYGAQIASEVHQELKKLGGVKPPKEFVVMDRAAVGLGSVFMHLKAEVNWYRIFHELIEDFNSKKLMKNQQKALNLADLSI